MTGATAIPWIVEAALKNRQQQFVIDGEAVLLGVDGISDLNGCILEVKLYAFGVPALEGEDLRKLPLHLRKNNLARLLARRPAGIFVSEFGQGEIGPDRSRGLQLRARGRGVEAPRSAYHAGRSADWIKVKNRKHPTIERVKESFS